MISCQWSVVSGQWSGEGDDSIDASTAEGNNRIYGDGDDDTFILGKSDRLVGAEGADSFFATSGGDNTYF